MAGCLENGPAMPGDLLEERLGSMILESKGSYKGYGKGSSGMGGATSKAATSKHTTLGELKGKLLPQAQGQSPPSLGFPYADMSGDLDHNLGSKILASKGLASGASTQSTCTPTSVLEDLDDMLEMDKSILLLDTINETTSEESEPEAFENERGAKGAGVVCGSGVPGLYKFCSGDFYREQDDVVRGVSIASMPPPFLPFPGQESLLGDLLYPGKKEMHNDFDFFGNPTKCLLPGKDDFLGFPMQMEPPPAFSLDKHERFEQGGAPPAQPKSQHFQLKSTAVHIKSSMPHDVANCMLDFLTSQVVASISKVNFKKFTIKADAFLENIMCSMKIRIWESAREQGEFTLEFQRRGGDAFAFDELYHQACSFLAGRFQGAMHADMAKVGQRLPSPPPLPNFQRSEADLAPLLDMLAMEQVPAMQAEAASELANLCYQDPEITKLLCNTEFFDELVKLLAAERLDISYPAARLLSVLAKSKQAEHFLTHHQLLKIAVQKISGTATGQIARLELVKAVAVAVQRCAHQFSADTAQELGLALDSAMQSIQELNEKEANSVVESGLQEALLDLGRYHPIPMTR